MAWPVADDLRRRLNLPGPDDWDEDMERLIAAGIRWAKLKVGDWNEDTDAPDHGLAQVALDRSVELATGEGLGNAPIRISKAEAGLYGYRRRFGIG